MAAGSGCRAVVAAHAEGEQGAEHDGSADEGADQRDPRRRQAPRLGLLLDDGLAAGQLRERAQRGRIGGILRRGLLTTAARVGSSPQARLRDKKWVKSLL